MDVNKIANEIYKTVDDNYPIPRFFSDSIRKEIEKKLYEQLIIEAKEQNELTDKMIRESESCTQERTIALAFERMLLNLGLRNEGMVETP